ncbi:Uncharacterised protein [Burkholderia pseudomallei]|uniref:hypothetical protein n=1 Tax=Burkholderia pseudomallei TaxID=28450 RepID=UPI000F083906|nr:hypothetical protein [Burkholderia pseudomallei]CAJ2828728.1 Uncharacterised protein [Burkholderia pseudomallei]VCP80658.1 Uncharacterised protein [Burkholderia pseudomallei]VCP93059.1 Uncharacterised protein [Burkholderia pseudomallei]VCP94930.1 Uncharacterised protein [Burkholderia pseudomallei]VCP97899.1 Uncharacterised protein [Burkholderia pseudomallei]
MRNQILISNECDEAAEDELACVGSIAPENLHSEVNFGQSVGREVWPTFNEDDEEVFEGSKADESASMGKGT